MKYIDEYRDETQARAYLKAIEQITKHSWSIMEICGGQTHSIIKYGIDQMISDKISIIHGPGCPVCVTPLEKLDRAMAIAKNKNVIFTTFGDMIRVPGSHEDLLQVKAQGGDVRIVYSPMDAIKIAKENPTKEVVFFGIGFETTVAVNAMALYAAKSQHLKNFSMLVSQVMVPPAMETLLSDAENRVQGFLAAGHVCSIMGYHEYEPIAKKFGIPIVVTGFEPLDILQGIHILVSMLETNKIGVQNQYVRVVTRAGNEKAQDLIKKVFIVSDQKWRGLGNIPNSGLAVSEEYREFDAAIRFNVADIFASESSVCQSGAVLRGILKPDQCAAFGHSCTPENPLGAPMVSGEGACSAYYKYRAKK